MAIPEEEEHKNIINKNIKIINIVLTISIFILLCILIFKNTNTIDKSFIYILLFIQSVTLYLCNIKWNQKLMLYAHYLYCISVYLSLFSSNIYILFYFLIVIILNIYIWHINDDSCIFGGLDWGNATLEYWGAYCFRVIPLISIYKIFNLYRKSTNLSITTDIPEINLDKPLENILVKISEKVLDETISFDELHDNLSKSIN